jgi:hypothetical protein
MNIDPRPLYLTLIICFVAVGISTTGVIHWSFAVAIALAFNLVLSYILR